jgi:hypothetical protein
MHSCLKLNEFSQLPSVTIPNLSIEAKMLSTSVTYPNIMASAASTLDELLTYYDQAFVVCAYYTLLGRTPDPEGLNYYLGRLRAGISKIHLLAQLRSSNEGKLYAAELPSLDTAIQRHQRGQYPLIGWLFRLYYGVEGNQPTERKLRSIENQLFLLSDESNCQFNHLETMLASLHPLLGQQTQSVAALGMASKDASETASVNPLQSPVPDELKQLSPRAQDIYFQLKEAAGHVGRGRNAYRD